VPDSNQVHISTSGNYSMGIPTISQVKRILDKIRSKNEITISRKNKRPQKRGR
jgi:hypothetical protein